MMSSRSLARDQDGAAAIEMAFALPTLIVMIWMMVQLGQVYRAVAGIQQALGEGARYATLCLSPSTSGCTTPTGTQISNKVNSAVYGIGPGSFNVTTPAHGTSGTSGYYDLTVTYTQQTNLLLFRGPTINVTRSKRVWVAGA
jgi:Flp pilus assembly protein TadG